MNRIGRTLAVASAGLLALLGLLTHAEVVAVGMLVVGPLTALCLYAVDPGRGDSVRLAATATVVLLGLFVVVAGVVELLGDGALPVITLLVVAAGTRLWRGHHPRPDLPFDRPSRPDGRAGTTPLQLPAARTGPVPVSALCASWQDTYRLIRDLPMDSVDHALVAEIRKQLLDEIERRDPAGFARWMHTGPRACSDPSRYLTADD